MASETKWRNIWTTKLCVKDETFQRVTVVSLPHGTVVDSVVDGLHPYLEMSDLTIDASNEDCPNAQRGQGKLATQAVHNMIKFLAFTHPKKRPHPNFAKGTGVSGGYQAARRALSMCPGHGATSPPEGDFPRRAWTQDQMTYHLFMFSSVDGSVAIM